jgi:hypothetical protein
VGVREPGGAGIVEVGQRPLPEDGGVRLARWVEPILATFIQRFGSACDVSAAKLVLRTAPKLNLNKVDPTKSSSSRTGWNPTRMDLHGTDTDDPAT